MKNGAAHKARLLLVEDNPGDVELLRWALRRASIECELEVLPDGGAALDFIRSGESKSSVWPDLVILDLNLPKASGREVLSAMRATSPFEETPVVILTSSDAPDDRAQMATLNIRRYLVKPPDLRSVLDLGHSIREVLDTLPSAARRAG